VLNQRPIGQPETPKGLAFDHNGNLLVLSGHVAVFRSSGEFVWGFTRSDLAVPYGIGVDKARIVIADYSEDHFFARSTAAGMLVQFQF